MPTWLIILILVWLGAVTFWCLWMHWYLCKSSKWVNETLLPDYWKVKKMLDDLLATKFPNDWQQKIDGADVPPKGEDYP